MLPGSAWGRVGREGRLGGSLRCRDQRQQAVPVHLDVAAHRIVDAGHFELPAGRGIEARRVRGPGLVSASMTSTNVSLSDSSPPW